MMRTSLNPLATLVDAAAEKWLAVADAAEGDQLPVWEKITSNFRIGDKSELTFHGLRYQMCITRDDAKLPDQMQALHIDVHEIVTNN